MFAARTNQENAIYAQQTAAAAKPLNQGVKGLAPKTPGNKAPKTPFKAQHNDENAAGKTNGKGKGGLFGEGKAGKADKSAFVTPAGPRNRAPLGNKTTNVKATAFQTPAPVTVDKQSAKHTSPRMRRAKIKIHEAEPETVSADEEEEREIEYMPPREIPLPDHPDDWPNDRTYPQFEGKNLTKGWYSEFAPQKDENEDEEFSDFEERLKRIEELNKKKKQAQQAKKATAAVKVAPLQKTTRDPLAAKPAQRLTDKSAASALAKKTCGPSFAAPTAAAKARLPSAMLSQKPAVPPTVTGNPRHTAAKVASNSTLGYSKGRAVSASAKQPLGGLFEQPEVEIKPHHAEDAKTSLHDLFGEEVKIEEDEEDEECFQLGGVELE